ncbi:hypothetical protein LCGC14_1358210 [marine sediment metagenome]|uniref:Uncharacterized protein n=1 Tax=marine sediment metagenome TaxID=412755 RepID=A0A0F9K9G3_9ZZZZ
MSIWLGGVRPGVPGVIPPTHPRLRPRSIAARVVGCPSAPSGGDRAATYALWAYSGARETRPGGPFSPPASAPGPPPARPVGLGAALRSAPRFLAVLVKFSRVSAIPGESGGHPCPPSGRGAACLPPAAGVWSPDAQLLSPRPENSNVWCPGQGPRRRPDPFSSSSRVFLLRRPPVSVTIPSLGVPHVCS